MALPQTLRLGRYGLFFLLGCGSIIVALSATLWSADRAIDQIERAQKDHHAITISRAHIDYMKFRQTTTAPSRTGLDELTLRYEILVSRVRSIEAMYGRVAATTEERRAVAALGAFVVNADAAFAERSTPDAMFAELAALATPVDAAFQILEAGTTARSAAALTHIQGRAQASIRKTRHLAIFCGVITFVFSAALWRAARQLERKNANLSELSARLRTVADYRSQFLANASHELRTPLNAIKGFAQSMLYLGEGLAAEKRSEYLTDIAHSATNLERLTEDLLDLSKIDAGHFELREETVSLDDLARRAARCVAPAAQAAGVVIEAEAATGLTLYCDAPAIERCLINLLSNAVKFSAAGEIVRIATGVDGDAVTIEVADHGCGIPEDQLKVIWEFYGRSSLTRHSDKQGTGLGLPISRALAEAHGGDITVRSAPGEGAAFTIRLPVRRIVEAPLESAPHEADAA